MTLIFAKLNTDEKIVIDSIRPLVPKIQITLNNNYGGQWILVDHLLNEDILLYQDGQVYKGFNPNIKRYSNILNINK